MFILINKPAGWTSHDVIGRLRRITGEKRIGHAGTLDPFATGLLIVAISRESTKQIDQFVKLNKEYLATIKLGATTDTYDKTGKIQKSKEAIKQENKNIKKALESFIGPQLQIPPMFSAKKVNGKKLYELARRGKEIERKPSQINITDLEIIDYHWPDLKIKVNCSSGTYIRSLAHDLGIKLGCGGYLEELTRTKIGNFDLKNAITLDKLTPENWQTLVHSTEYTVPSI
ncbi:MAG: tRNA pseudouridine(55) synthase TruB [Patescibacteria group bacterium]